MSESNTFQSGEVIVFTPFIHAFGGVERLLISLSRYLHEQGRAHRIICFEDTISLASHASWPLTLQELRPKRTPWAEARALQGFLRSAQSAGAAPTLLFDLKSAFYAGLSPPPPFFLHLTDPPSLLPLDVSKKSASARRAYAPFAAAPKAKAVKMAHAEVVHRLNRRGARRAAKVLAMTHTIAHELEQLYGVKAHVVRPGIVPSAAPLRALDSGTTRMLSVCRLEENKRIDWMLRALHDLEAATPRLSERTDWSLHIVGQGSQQEALQRMAASLQLESRVVFHGRVSDAELETIYAGADLFLMPAVQGYGLPALESLERGIPVILHRESGVAEILSGTPWAQIIEHDVQSLTQALDIMVERQQSDVLKTHSRPAVPTETQWAKHICQVCEWLSPPGELVNSGQFSSAKTLS